MFSLFDQNIFVKSRCNTVVNKLMLSVTTIKNLYRRYFGYNMLQMRWDEIRWEMRDKLTSELGFRVGFELDYILELDFRVRISSWIFELGFRVGFSN